MPYLALEKHEREGNSLHQQYVKYIWLHIFESAEEYHIQHPMFPDESGGCITIMVIGEYGQTWRSHKLGGPFKIRFLGMLGGWNLHNTYGGQPCVW